MSSVTFASDSLSDFFDANLPKEVRVFGVLIRATADASGRQPSSSVIGHLKPRTLTGEVLIPGPVGRIPEGCYYMGSAHKDGFDSRYAAIGFVCRRQIVGVATKVLL